MNLLTLVKLRPSVLHLGYKGALLLARLLSIPAGFKFLTDANYVDHELEKWRKVTIAERVGSYLVNCSDRGRKFLC